MNIGGENFVKKEFNFILIDTQLTDKQILSLELYNDIQLWKYDANSELLLLKGMTYANAISVERTRYNTRKNIDITEKQERFKEETDKLKLKAKTITSTETVEGITIEIERYEAIIEGDSHSGTSKCPLCGFVLMRWCR